MRTYRPQRSIALRYRIGIAAAFLTAALFAAESAQANGIVNISPPPLSMLVKFNDRPYEIQYSETVSLEPLSTTTVRKVGYGQVRNVNIATTATGTYSSDALVSPHVQYPGISVSRVFESVEDSRRSGPGFSIFSIGQNPTGGVVINHVNDLGVRSCVGRGSFLTCYRTY